MAQPQDALSRLQQLRNQHRDMEVMLISINGALRDAGIDMNEEEYVPTLQNGIRIKGKLSQRGKEKAGELFDILDEDNDGFLCFDEFRGIASLQNEFGVLGNEYFSNIESWQMFLHDMGLQCKDGLMDKDNYIQYRCLTELKTPLSIDLATLNLSPLPNNLLHWQLLKSLILESHRATNKKHRIENTDISNPILKLHIDEVPYILHNANIHLSRLELYKAMLIRAKFDKLIKQLKQKSLKLNYVESATFEHSDMLERAVLVQASYNGISFDDLLFATCSNFIGWSISNNRRPNSDTHEVYQYALKLKYGAFRFLRIMDYQLSYLCNIMIHLKQRRVFRGMPSINDLASITTDLSKTLTTIDTTCTVNQGNIQEGFRINWKLTTIEDPMIYLAELNFKAETGLVVYLDLLVNKENEKNMKKLLSICKGIRKLLTASFERELKRLGEYRDIVVSPGTDMNGSTVIKIGFTFSRRASIDYWLNNMGLPYCFHDIVKAVSGDVFSSIDFLDIWDSVTASNTGENVYESIDAILALKIDYTLSYRKDIVSQILQRIIEALSCGLSEEQIKHRLKFTGEESQLDQTENNIMMKDFPRLASIARWLLLRISALDLATVVFKYRCMSELIAKISANNLWIKKSLPLELFYVDGGMSNFINNTLKFLSQGLSWIKDRAQAFLNKKVEADELEKKENLRRMMDAEKIKEDFEKRKGNVLELLERIGVNVDGNMFNQTEITDPILYLQQVEDDMLFGEINTLLILQQLQDTCTGLSLIEVISGKSKFSVTFDGFDIFTILPKFPCIDLVINDIDIEREKRGLKSMKEKLNSS